MCVCMCVFNSGMNLILIPPTLGMGNSCLNELNSGFKIASICSQSEPAPVEATLRFGAHQGAGAGFGLRDGKGHRLAGPMCRFKASLAMGQVPAPLGFLLLHL